MWAWATPAVSSRATTSATVAALGRRQRSQSCRVQSTRDSLEAVRLLRPPVQQHDGRRIRRSRVDHVEAQPRAYEMVHISPSKAEVSAWQSVAYRYRKE